MFASKDIADSLRQARTGCVQGLPRSARALLLNELQHELGRPMAGIVENNEVLVEFAQALRAVNRLAPDNTSDPVLTFPSLEIASPGRATTHAGILHARAMTLARLRDTIENPPRFFLISAPALLCHVLPESVFSSSRVELNVGEDYDPEHLEHQLRSMGYLPEDKVLEGGEYSHRGGVFDIFPVTRSHPLRLEFFGDTVRSIRTFDPRTQRSQPPSPGHCPMTQMTVLPESELVVTPESLLSWKQLAFEHGMGPEDIAHYVRGLETGERFAGIEQWLPWFYPQAPSLVSLLKNRLMFVDENVLCLQAMKQHTARAALVSKESETPCAALPLANPDEGEALLSPDSTHPEGAIFFRQIALGESGNEKQEKPVWTFHARTPLHFASNMNSLSDYLREKLRPSPNQEPPGTGSTVLLALSSNGRVRRLYNSLRSLAVPVERVTRLPEAGKPCVEIIRLPLPEGFTLNEPSFEILTDREIFGDSPPLPVRPLPSSAEAFTSDFRDLRTGDLLVHQDHGIGRFAGLTQLTIGETSKGAKALPVECLELQFHGSGKVFVPVDRIDLVEKYSASESYTPSLSKLGSRAWPKLRDRVKKAAEGMAKELLELHSQRASDRAYAFADDSPWQKDFEEAFEYELTPGQHQASQETKRDMEKSRPMDRLLIGDVGFGKTEVALRAVFKAVSEGKQVAILAPTTVLVEQHLRTFTKRFEGFPVLVRSLSRLVSSKDQKETLKWLAEGKCDVVVGTQRLLSKDVKFKSLELLIVDEEQRFGVRQKENLKKIKSSVHVLTLTATPIPRTLSMAMSGLRELSVIQTPPPGRLAVHTVVMPSHPDILQSAIDRELRRHGQVYYVHNDIPTLYFQAEVIRKLCPKARVGILHGQMKKKAIEDALLAFVHGRTDVLASTTIIENGLDIPAVNTLIVDRADKFGLAQLYQLRGRVGRSSRRAYTYLFVPPETEWTKEVRERLRAIQEFSFLGAGFRLAAADLEIRGAGHLLGKAQSGHMAAVGFDMYVRLLEEAVDSARGHSSDARVEPLLKFDLDLRIPQDYAPEMNERLAMYRSFATAASREEAEARLDEFEDRWGPAPEPLRNLMALSSLKAMARRLRIERIEVADQSLFITFHETSRVDPRRLVTLIQKNPAVTRTPAGLLRVDLPQNSRERSAAPSIFPLETAEKLLHRISLPEPTS